MSLPICFHLFPSSPVSLRLSLSLSPFCFLSLSLPISQSPFPSFFLMPTPSQSSSRPSCIRTQASWGQVSLLRPEDGPFFFPEFLFPHLGNGRLRIEPGVLVSGLWIQGPWVLPHAGGQFYGSSRQSFLPACEAQGQRWASQDRGQVVPLSPIRDLVSWICQRFPW